MALQQFPSAKQNGLSIELCKKDNLEHKIQKFFDLKRVFDVVFSFAIILFLSPVFLLIAILIKIYSPDGPVFYAHKRLGLNGEEFDCYKFRTMIPDADKKLREFLANNPELKEDFEKNFKLKNDPRIIPVIGSFLRKTSLDEFPQFLNALKGEMSVVGPRPIVRDEIQKYGLCQNLLFSVKPGITGLWQISGRNDINYDSRILFDMQYITKASFLMDLNIIFKTILIMLTKKGAY